MSKRRWHHPQVRRAAELARAAGLNPYQEIIKRDEDGRQQRERVYRRYMETAFEEHFAREAVDNIYWNHECWNVQHRDSDCLFFYGRCKSGQRWFWRVHGWGWDHHQTGEDYLNEHGWADTEAQGLVEGTAAIKRLAGERRVIAYFNHGGASSELKRINKDKRTARLTARPSTVKDSKVIEYLYGDSFHHGDVYLKRFRITKRTAKRVYYLRKAEYIDEHGEPRDFGRIWSSSDSDATIGFVDRQKLEAKGEVYNRGVHWSSADHHLHISLQDLLASFGNRYRPEEKPDLRKLKAEMAAAHPDRGGSHEAFITARAAYEAALAALKETAP